MKRVFIFGYYGFGNLGDEATLDSIIQMIREVNKDTKIEVLTYNSEATANAYEVKAVSRNHYLSIIKAIKSADVVISGGGTLLQDVTSHRSLIYYLSLIFLAKCFGKEVIFFSNGFGPINGNKWLTRLICQSVDGIILRDEASKIRMEKLGIKKGITVTTDVTFKLMPKNKQTYQRKVALSLRPWKVGGGFHEAIKQFVAYLLEKGYAIDLIAMEKGADEAVFERLLENFAKSPHLKVVVSENHYDILEAIGTSKIFVGMRLHAGIFSLMNERPIIALNYDPKVKALVNDFSQIGLNLDEQLTFEHIKVAFDTIEENYEVYVEKIRSTLEEKKASLAYNYELLTNMLKQ